MSGKPWLEVSDQGRGLIRLVGDPAALPVGSGGLLAVRRIGDDYWLSGARQWQSGPPQWFPFDRDTLQASTTVLEITATPLLDLFASPPAEALSARLRFPALAGRDARELDLELRVPGALLASAGPSADLTPASAETPAIAALLPSEPSDVGSGYVDAPLVHAMPDAIMADLEPMRPEVGLPSGMAISSDATSPLTVAHAEGIDLAGETSSWDNGSAAEQQGTEDQASDRNRRQWPRIGLVAIPALLLLLVIVWLWPDHKEDPPPKVCDRAYVVDLLATKPPPSGGQLYSEAEEADAEGQCDCAILLYRAAAKVDAALAGRLGGKLDPEGFVPSPCIKESSSTSAQVWYAEAAEAGDAIAQRRLGELMLDEGAQGAIRQEAIKWLCKATDNGDALAEQRLWRIGESCPARAASR